LSASYGKETIRIDRIRNEMGNGIKENFDFSISRNNYFKDIIFVFDLDWAAPHPSNLKYITKCILRCGGKYIYIGELRNVFTKSKDFPRDSSGCRYFSCHYFITFFYKLDYDDSGYRLYDDRYNNDYKIYFKEYINLRKYTTDYKIIRPLMTLCEIRLGFNKFFETIFEEKMKLEYLESLTK
jgi:hypothetical protein